MEKLNEIQKNLKVAKNQRNKFGNYNYRSCEDILEAVKPLLGEATLTISDEVVCLGGEPAQVADITKQVKEQFHDVKEVISGHRFYVKATATLKLKEEEVSVSGWAREAVSQKGMNESQITGAASSYARKYALNGLFAIDDTNDADTMDNTHPTTAKTTPKTVSKPKEVQTGKKLTDADIAGLHCSICGGMPAISYRKNPNGVIYCSNFKEHKTKDFPKFVTKGEYDKSRLSQQIADDLPDINV